MSFEKINKIALFVFGLFLIFTSIVILVGEFMENTLIAIVIFISFLYVAYYIILKTLFKD